MKDITLYTATTSGNAKNTVYPTVAHITDVDAFRAAMPIFK